MIGIINGKLLTITEGNIDRGTILTEGGRIVAIGQDLEVPEDAEIYDAAGKVVRHLAAGVGLRRRVRRGDPRPGHVRSGGRR